MLHRRLPRVLLAAFAAVLLSVAPASAAISRADAGKRALSALGVKQGKQPVVVFQVRTVLHAGTRITQAGNTKAPTPHGKLGTSTATAPVLLQVGKGRSAWAFYADWAPYQTYAHRGQVALVDARSGAVRLSSFLSSPPVIGGHVPEFMRSGAAYRDAKHRIFERTWQVDDTAALTLANRAGLTYKLDRAPLSDMALAKQAADQLAADHTCVLRVSDTFGDFYDFTGADNTRARLGDLFYVLRQLNPGIVDQRYTRTSGGTPLDALRDLIASKGCQDVLLYIAGRGYSSGTGTTVGIGTRVRGRTVVQQLVRATDLASLVHANPGVRFSIKVDAPYSKGFVDLLAKEPNVLLAESAAGADGSSFGYLPYVTTSAGKRLANTTNPDGVLAFTNRTIAGITRFLTSTDEVSSAIAARRNGTSPSFLAQLLGRAFSLGEQDDLPAVAGIQKPFFAPTDLNPKGPPAPPAPTPTTPNRAPLTTPLTVTTAEDTAATFGVPATDPDGDVLAISATTGPSHGTITTSGLSVTYTPAADYAGPDEITFTVTDPKGLTATATVTIIVTGANDKPRITTTSGSAAFTEGGAAVAVDPTLQLVDVDDTTLSGATATITAGGSADDQLLFTTQNGITGSFDAPTGALTLSGSAAVAQYEAALRSITFRVTGANPAGGTRTVSFRAADAEGLGAPATRTIAVTTINDAPVLANASGTLSYTENDAPTAIDPGFAITDPDSPTFAGATVAITTGFQTAEDRLRFTTQNGITGSFNTASGVLTLTGTATRAQYETALRTVAYENLSDDPSTSSRTVSTQVDDGASASNLSNTVTDTVSVAPVNDAPVVTASTGTASYTENASAVTVDGGLTVTDADSANLGGATVSITTGFASGDALTFINQNGITGSYNAGTGVLTLSGTATVANYQAALRSITYSTPSDDPSTTTRVVSFVARDTAPLASTAATRSVSVTAVNDAPVLGGAGGTVAYTENGAGLAIATGLTVSDADSTNLTGATASITTGFAAGDVLTFVNQNGITGSYNSGTGVLTLTGSATVANYQAALRSITFSTPSDDPSTTSRVVSFTADDGAAANHASNTVTQTVTVTAVNDAPAITTTGGSTAFTEGDSATVIDSGLTVADPDNANLTGATVSVSPGFAAGDTLGFTNQNGITGSFNSGTGVLTLSGSASVADYQAALRSITYFNASTGLPSANHTIRFTATDGTDTSTAATKVVHFGAVNSAPVVTASGGSTAVTEGAAAVVIDSGLTVTDADDATLDGASVAVTAGLASGDTLAFTDQNGITGSFNSATGVLTLSGTTTLANYETALRSVKFSNAGPSTPTGTRTITFAATDSSADSGSDTKGITFTAIDDAPVVTTSAGSTAYTENAAPIAVDSALIVSDPDSANLASAEVSLTDAVGGDRLAVPGSYVVPGTLTVTGSNTTTITISGAATPTQYRDLLRAITFESTSDDPTSATRHVRFKAADATTTTTAGTDKAVAVTAVNDAPVAVADGFTTDEDTVKTGDVRANDTDLDDTTASLTVDRVNGLAGNVGNQITLASGARVTIDASGNVSYDPRGAWDALQVGDPNGTDSVTYRVKDPGNATSNTATVTFTITPVNDAPTAVARSYNAVTNAAVELEPAANSGITAPKVRIDGDLLQGASDPDDSIASASITDETVASTRGGSADIDPDGSFVYTSSPGESASSDTFTFHIKDTHGATSTQTVTLDFKAHVFFVDGDQAVTGDGTSTDPYKTVTEASAASSSGDTLYVADATPQTASAAVLKNNVVVTGAGKALTVNLGATGTPSGTQTLKPAVSRPVLSASSGSALTLASGNTVQGLDIDTSGTAKGISAASAGAVTITDVAVNDQGSPSSGTAVDLAGASGTISNLDITTQNGTGLNLSGSSVSIGTGSTISATGAPAITSSGATGGTLAFDTVSSSNSGSTGISLAGAAAFSAPAGTVTGSSGIGVDVSGGTAAISYGGSISPDAGVGVARVQSRTGGTTALSGNLTTSGNAAAVSVSNNTGGTITFSGASKTLASGTATAVNLLNNTGATVQFTGGGLAATSTTGDAFRATGGGTVQVAGSANTLSAGSGAALHVANTTTNGLTFQSITDTGGTEGVYLDTTGSGASLTVTGDSGTTRNTSGGVISGVTAGDGSTTGNGIYLNDTDGVSLEQMQVTSSGNNGLAASNVIGLSFKHGTITSNGDNSATPYFESNVRVSGSTGTLAFDDDALSTPQDNNVYLTHDAGSATLQVTNSALTMDPTRAGSQGDGVLADGGASGSLTATITGNTFSGAAGDHVQIAPGGTNGNAAWTATISNNSMISTEGGTGDDLGGGVTVSPAAFNGTLGYTLDTNTIRGTRQGGSIDASQGSGTSVVNGTITGNVIGINGDENSGASESSGIVVDAGGTGSHTALVQGNTIYGTSEAGIIVEGAVGGASATAVLNATVKGNTVGTPSNDVTYQSLYGIYANLGIQTAQTGTNCVDIQGNTLTGTVGAGGYFDLRLRKRATVTVQLPGYTGAATDSAALSSYLSGRNTIGPSGISATASGASGGFANTSGGAPCTQPS